MGSDELKAFLTALSGRDMKIRIAEFLQQKDCIAEAMDIAVGESGSEAFRAAWGISAIYETNRFGFLSCQPPRGKKRIWPYNVEYVET